MAQAPSSQPQTVINTSIEQQQLNNFLGPVNGALGGQFVKAVADYLEAWDVNKEI